MFRYLSAIFIALLSFNSWASDESKLEKALKIDSHFSGLAEITDFPYICTYLDENTSASRAASILEAKEDELNYEQDKQNYKPLKAEYAENDLSHLLTWMKGSIKSDLRGMAVYDEFGMLRGMSGYEVANQAVGYNHNRAVSLKEYDKFFDTIIADDMYKKLGDLTKKVEQIPDNKFIAKEALTIDNKHFIVAYRALSCDYDDKVKGYITFVFDQN